MSDVDYAKCTTEELIGKFADTAKRAGTVFTFDKAKILNPRRPAYVQELQVLGAELRRRNAIEKLRPLFEHDDPGVRGCAGQQFLGVDPDWASAAITGLCHNMSTREVLAWRARVLGDPSKQPPLGKLTISQILARFIDACERLYGSTRFLTDAQGGGLTMRVHNIIAGDVYAAAKELNRRGQLRALEPLLEHTLITVRQRAARYCLPVASEAASATLENVAAVKEFPESGEAMLTLTYWRNGQYCAFPDDPKQVRA